MRACVRMCMCTHTYTAYIGGGGSIYQNQMSMLHTKTHIKCIVYHHETASPYDITVIVENDEFIDEFGIDENVVNWDFEKYPLYLSEQSDNRIAIILRLCGVKFDYSDGPTAYTWVQLW